MIKIIAKNTVKPEMIEAFKNAVKPLIEASRNEKGCVSYDLFEDCNNPNVLTFIEEWEDEKAIEVHNKSQHFTQIVPTLAGFAAADSEINLYKPVL